MNSYFKTATLEQTLYNFIRSYYRQKFVEVAIVDDEEYEKDENFFIELGKPRQGTKDGHDSEPEDNKMDELTMMTEEDRRIAEMGRPQLGEIARIEVKIMESSEFKNTVDKLIKKTNLSLVVGTSSWREQFVEALTVSAGGDDDGDDDGDEVEEKLPSVVDYIMHFLTIFWKVLFAFVPPTDYLGGWACFTVSIIWIAILTALIGDLATMFGCTIGLMDSVTAISFVALGTSVPVTIETCNLGIFRALVYKLILPLCPPIHSQVNGCRGDKHADASSATSPGATLSTFSWYRRGVDSGVLQASHGRNQFCVDPGSLGFSVTLYTCFAVVSISVLMIRRVHPKIGAELGGPKWAKIPTSLFFVCLWLLYILISTLEAYDVIQGF
ncbi:putative sodium/calcium exchanger 3 isoform X5 [Apostichopus japonicus]|uniref:Putative sodium/calcium exchanger 3 isoform X5 n=1 Tax=Stichopus japonicus TaxID=307972 RepID=A0A2G8LQZ2_STIJA|nr:putative sodium/calcium exchanger 3 isoform X5 [Apostichopus japonicus]